MTVARARPSWVEVDLAAIRANAQSLAALVRPAGLCAVVKADGYGHGATAVAEAALAGGASWLAVAVVEEGVELRKSGVEADILVLADAPVDAIGDATAAWLALTVSSSESIDAVAQVAPHGAPVHLKIDTGMHRLGCDPTEAVGLARRIIEAGLKFEGAFTHLPSADDPSQDELTSQQLERFDAAIEDMRASGYAPKLVHAASSAAALHCPLSRNNLVRCGISLYGYAPSLLRPLPDGLALKPALSVKSQVVSVRAVAAGEGVGYGWKWTASSSCRIATIPLGYADGVPRGLSGRAEVLIRGRRRQLAAVTMDQVMVDCGDDVEPGDEVVLIGRQGSQQVTADEWGQLTGTISYEILARLGPRLPRRYNS